MKNKKNKFSFKVKGHKNILSKHKTTLEFTQDENLTLKGDCILGVNANKDFSEIKNSISGLKDGNKIIVNIVSSKKDLKHQDILSGHYNDLFESNKEMVMRKSDFKDKRTLMINSSKAAIDVDRKIVRNLQKSISDATISIKKANIKNIVFDFDNTLEEWQQYEDDADLFLSEIAIEKFGMNIKKEDFAKQFRISKEKFIAKRSKPKYYGRDVWLKDTLKKFNVKFKNPDVELLTSLYWDYIIKRVKLFPGVKPLLSSLSKKYKLFMLSDSDGNVEVKNRRIDKFDIRKYFTKVYTSDDSGWNKPQPKFYEWFIKKTRINPHETISVGDHPETDLVTSKSLGMSTVWLKKGQYAKESKYGYVDYEINEIVELKQILKKFE